MSTKYRGDVGEVLAVDPADQRLAGKRWLLLWAVDPLGECVCPAGTKRWSVGGAYSGTAASAGSRGRCGSPGKHPWSPAVDGARGGFAHGAADAVELAELHAMPRSRVYRPALTLADLIVVDIDSPRSLRDYARIRHAIPPEKIMGVGKTPRGWHVYLDAAGWNQRALNLWTEHWLGVGRWDPVDPRKVDRRGWVLDFRTGARRYVVWPGGSGEDGRRWARAGEFEAAVARAGRGLPHWRLATEEPDRRAPWNLDMDEKLRRRVDRYEGSGWAGVELGGNVLGDVPVLDLDSAGALLDMWCGQLARMEPETGRNNTLNRIAFFDGAAAVRAGMPREAVEDKLRAAAAACGCPGAEATIASGLDSGLGA